ncbi:MULTISPECIES: TonB-dependent receptor [unclassified Janthinobacterium]|uniref:TonB-dependent receptor n=1 Tax=unclassified Janthinobacterium TaxID=2610881 RepID=UPI0016202E3D|nr:MULTISPECIES: TonB-dependent receptor [unclassified Janthinobacterium]MBB5606867.1 iron complex outermembrane receptor protein [Janthinobacterium sp. S3T4]MBB5612083.1 iron complex outermembrane receptor protein [Janthinobacterium sp. S3M3]
MKRNLTVKPIAVAVAMLMAGASFSAYAQNAVEKEVKPAAAADAADGAEGPQVVVTGIRASLQQSLNQKRNSDSFIEVITAEDVGKMPDKNIADSLQRIPGVSVAAAGGNEGSFGENDRVALRGTPFGLTLTTFNGHSVSSGDWFADNIIGGGRSVSFSLFPSELIGRVTVHKGSQANLLEGGAEGVIDIESRKPLDFKKPFSGQVSLGGVYSSNSGKKDPQFSGMLNWKNDTNTLGVMLQGFYQKRSLSRVGQENGVWYDEVKPDSAVAGAIPGSAGGRVNYMGGTAWFEQVRTRKGGLLDVQVKPSSDLMLDFSLFHSELDAPNINHNFIQTVGLETGSKGGYPVGNVNGTYRGGIVTGLHTTVPANCGTICDGYSSAVQEEFSRPVAESKSDFFNVDAKYRVNDRLTVSGKVGTTKGVGNTQSGALGIWMPWTGGGYTQNGADHGVIYDTPGADKFSMGGRQATPYTYGSHVTANDKETYGQVDAILKLDHTVINSIEFGARVAEHKRDLRSIAINDYASLSNPANLPMNGLTSFPGKFNDLGVNGAGYWTFSQDSVNQWLKANSDYNGKEQFQSEFQIKEPTQALYAMANFGSEGFSGNFGLRYVRTKEDVNRYEITAPEQYGLKNYTSIYNDFLPSANLRLDVTKDIVGRFGISRTMARPELGMMAGLDLRDNQLDGNVGNPNLRPIYANNADIGVEWYFAPKSMLSADLFYSSLDGYVTYGKSKTTFYNQLQKKYTEYDTSTPLNTTGEVRGLELAYVQALPNGFGVNANYTYTDGKETGKVAGSTCGDQGDCTMIGTSKNAYNIGAFFENAKFSARLTYSYRSEFLNGTSRRGAAYQAGIGTLSASIAYQLTENLAITLDGKDLNNPLSRSVVKTPGSDDMPGAFYKNGRQIYLALQGKM